MSARGTFFLRELTVVVVVVPVVVVVVVVVVVLVLVSGFDVPVGSLDWLLVDANHFSVLNSLPVFSSQHIQVLRRIVTQCRVFCRCPQLQSVSPDRSKHQLFVWTGAGPANCRLHLGSHGTYQ